MNFLMTLTELLKENKQNKPNQSLDVCTLTLIVPFGIETFLSVKIKLILEEIENPHSRVAVFVVSRINQHPKTFVVD